MVKKGDLKILRQQFARPARILSGACRGFLPWLLFFSFQPFFAQGENVTLVVKEKSVEEIILQLRRETSYRFLFNHEEVRGAGVKTLDLRDNPIEEVMTMVLENTNLTFRVERDVVVITPRPRPQQEDRVTITGTIKDASGLPLPGVTVRLKGGEAVASSAADGRYTLVIPTTRRAVIVFSFIGMKTVEVAHEGRSPLDVTMEEEITQMDEIVVTGIFERKAESFTGSVASYSGTELKRVGTRNVLQSLKTLDPSFRITPDNRFGSDPNRLPDINIRGKSSISNIESEWGDDPNRPIFILDGFEVSLQTVVDLSMDRIASLNILKDAASTAMYGSRAANGVVVIETVKPLPGALQFSYHGSYDVEMPDLSGYNLMNAEEKLEFEKRSQFYDRASRVYEQIQWDNLYNKRLTSVRDGGVNSYWLSEPLRVGFTHAHNVRATGGDKSMYYSAGVNYSNRQGAMKRSSREIFGANINLQYHRGKLRLSEDFTIDYANAGEPPIPFYEYARVNPYYKKEINPNHPEYLEVYEIFYDGGGGTPYQVPNPLYNASLKHVDQSRSITLRNNFRVDYSPLASLKLRGKLNISKTSSRSENFKSPYHTDYAGMTKTERGTYTRSTAGSLTYNGDVSLTFGKVYNGVHQVNAVGRWEISSTTHDSDSYAAIGFPSDRVSNPAFAISYPKSGKPGYGESFRRSINMMVTANYGYASRYLIDVTYRRDGSSNFGANRLWANTWSVGLAWNLHNEAFIGEWARMLKLRFAYGNPGNNNQAFDTFLSYYYNTSFQNLFGLGARIHSHGNHDLDWQKTNDMTIGLDVAILDGRFSATLDYYRKVTDPLIVQVGVAPSTGKSSLITNLGMNTITGLTFKVDVRVLENKERDFRWSINAHGYHEISRYGKIGSTLDRFNNELRNTSVRRYTDGASGSDIWTVRSAGIDPMTGKEIFIKKNGSYTFNYDASDEVVCGSTLADLEGIIGTTLRYQGFSLGAHFRYSFGGDYFNHELYSRIENIGARTDLYNQDRRALHERWFQAGDQARYRSIDLYSTSGSYPKSSRYVQKNNFFAGESITAGYTFYGSAWLTRNRLGSLSLDATLGDIFRWSTVKAERGIEYPFGRTVSLSVNMTF
jgi:TonB-linked SusC/RagA family outer membrane protein